ncbi:ribonuclease HII [Moraxella sp. ZJ142]|uniref:ribonuclease HII n=1 Tax=Moraxella marmotae TaxID=3344520 RepID=UPI0035D4C0FF
MMLLTMPAADALINACSIVSKPNATICPKTPVVIGIDEVGRGALFANMTVSAVILPADLSGDFADLDLSATAIKWLNDSKKLSEKRRESLFEPICDLALDYVIVDVPRKIIDQINILNATMLGMRAAIETLVAKHQLDKTLTHILVDGHQFPSLDGGCAASFYQNQTVIKGDATHSSIACASVIAKVHRDRQMLAYADKYPEYQLATHKGYLTAKHKTAILTHGILPEHRRNFSPIRELYQAGKVNPSYWQADDSAIF